LIERSVKVKIIFLFHQIISDKKYFQKFTAFQMLCYQGIKKASPAMDDALQLWN